MGACAMGRPASGRGASRSGSRPMTATSDALAKTQKLNATRPNTVNHGGERQSEYRPISRAEALGGGGMTIRDQGKFEELVGCIGHKKPRRLQPLDTNAGQDGFLSERAMRKKFLEERKQRMEEQCAAEVEAMKRAVKWRIADMHAERDRREAARMAKIKEEQEGFIADVDQFLKNKLEQ